MSFGNRKNTKGTKYFTPVEYVATTNGGYAKTPEKTRPAAKGANKVSRPAKASSGSGGSGNGDNGSSGGFILIGCLALIPAIFGLLMFAGPITNTAPPKYYSRMDITQSRMSSWMIPAERKKREKRFGLDFSVIFTPPRLETSGAMREVAQSCLPGGGYKRWVMPNQAHKLFSKATDYLNCAMTTRQDRFCDSGARERLVAQLMQYRRLRQNLFAVERVRDAMFNTKQARSTVRMAQAVQSINGSGRRTLYNPKIGKSIDGRIGAKLRFLIQNDYLSTWDFGFLGFTAPAEYAPYLDASVVGAPNCSPPEG